MFFDNLEDFKSEASHNLKRLGDLEFIRQLVLSTDIEDIFYAGYQAHALYLLAMLDYVSRVNDIPLFTKYNEFRKLKLQEKLYPANILLIHEITKNPSILEEAWRDSIPEFKEKNIAEVDIRNVVWEFLYQR